MNTIANRRPVRIAVIALVIVAVAGAISVADAKPTIKDIQITHQTDKPSP